MNKAIFLDRDGTINVDYGYVYEKEKFEFLDGAIEGLKKLNDLGYILIIITNQSGIGRNFYSVQDFKKINAYMLNELNKNGIYIRQVYYCPHVNEDNCDCRKPKLGLFYKAINDYDIDIENSFVIGDKLRDLSICDKEQIKGILISEKENNKYICKKNLLEAANYIRLHNGSDN